MVSMLSICKDFSGFGVQKDYSMALTKSESTLDGPIAHSSLKLDVPQLLVMPLMPLVIQTEAGAKGFTQRVENCYVAMEAAS